MGAEAQRKLFFGLLGVAVAVAACGGKSSATTAAGSGGGANSLGDRAESAAGSGPSAAGSGAFAQGGARGEPLLMPGSPAECPEVMPVYQFDCPATLLDSGCTYAVGCQTGTQLIALGCNGKSWSSTNDTSCRSGDFCEVGQYQLQCSGNRWMVGGAGESSMCPLERPINGIPCYRASLDSTPPCGYFCPDGTWTVGSCSAGDVGEQRLEFSPACAGEALPSSAGAAGAN
jgi:hypothetical protein